MQPDGRDDPARPDGLSIDSGRVLAWGPGFDENDGMFSGITDFDAEDASLYREDSDPFDDLDLVITPVSVTPPRSWRRAAWFAVGASCVVLTVLVFAAARLAGPESPFDRLDAFPGLPTGGLLTAETPDQPPPATTAGPTTTADDEQTILGAPSGVDVTQVAGGPDRPDVQQPGVGPGRSTRTNGPAPTTHTGFETPSSPPSVSLLPTTGSPPVTAENMVAATQRFYNALPKNVEAAWAMVGPRVKVQGFENFRRQWANAVEVNLQNVLVDANDSSVLATVQIVAGDGGQYLQYYRLTFRQGSMLTIEDIQPAGGDDGNKPVR